MSEDLLFLAGIVLTGLLAFTVAEVFTRGHALAYLAMLATVSLLARVIEYTHRRRRREADDDV